MNSSSIKECKDRLEEIIWDIVMNGDNRGTTIPGIYIDFGTQIDREQTRSPKDASADPSKSIVVLSRQCDNDVAGFVMGRLKQVMPFKSYRQRKFYTAPGSRQDKYSQKRRTKPIEQ